MSNLTVANTMLSQLGGHKFSVVTDAENFCGGKDFLQFAIPLTNKINRLSITLTPLDTYTVKFMYVRGMSVIDRAIAQDVYCTDLLDAFEYHTGFATKL